MIFYNFIINSKSEGLAVYLVCDTAREDYHHLYVVVPVLREVDVARVRPRADTAPRAKKARLVYDEVIAPGVYLSVEELAAEYPRLLLALAG